MKSTKAFTTYVRKDKQRQEESLSIYGRWDIERDKTLFKLRDLAI